MSQVRNLCDIAQEIRADWTNPYFGAQPFLEAMETLTAASGTYGKDSAQDIVRRFLANAQHWKGPVARRIKEELRRMVGW